MQGFCLRAGLVENSVTVFPCYEHASCRGWRSSTKYARAYLRGRCRFTSDETSRELRNSSSSVAAESGMRYHSALILVVKSGEWLPLKKQVPDFQVLFKSSAAAESL
jgi:hypothetical protein